MFLSRLVPSWHEIESRIINGMGYQGGAHFRTHHNQPFASLSLNLRRVRAVQSAFNQANGRPRACCASASPTWTSPASSTNC